jgi:hypothetical protein
LRVLKARRESNRHGLNKAGFEGLNAVFELWELDTLYYRDKMPAPNR